MRLRCLTFFIGLLLSSCAVQRKGSEHVRVYKREMVGDVGPGPSYLILRGGCYEFFSPGAGAGSEFGSFTLSNDTLYIHPPEFGYINKKLRDIDTTKISFSTIPLLFLMDKEKLTDITDYRNYPELAPFVTGPGGIFDGFVRIK